MDKIKVLFVVTSLYRAGAERFAYEIDSALDKNKIQTTIFCKELKNEISDIWKERYYENRHLELGTSIVYKDVFLYKKKTFFNRLQSYISKKLKINNIKKSNTNLFDFLNSFDVIHWMGEYAYIHNVTDDIKNKSIINIMSARFQNDNIYEYFDFNKHYNFCSGFKNDELDYELNQFDNYNHTFIPLVLKMNPVGKQWRFTDEKKKIGVFTRIDRYKPLDPFLYAFHLLLDKMPNCELHFFGNGNPKNEGIIDIIERLNIKDKVFFRGHQDNIATTVFEENISLSWFQGYNNDRPAGYAGIDICITGLPLLCWDFHPNPNDKVNHIYPHYKNLNNFVNASLEILNDKQKAETLSNAQYEDVFKTRNVEDFIHELEEVYKKISKKKI